MKNASAVKELQEVLAQLVELLRAEGVLQYSPWVKRALYLTSWIDKEAEALPELKSLVKHAPTGRGTLYDLVLWRDTFEERVQINDRLDFLRWRVKELARSL